MVEETRLVDAINEHKRLLGAKLPREHHASHREAFQDVPLSQREEVRVSESPPRTHKPNSHVFQAICAEGGWRSREQQQVTYTSCLPNVVGRRSLLKDRRFRTVRNKT